MIHGNSNDPVLIKKISLRIWTLRDEIHAVVKRQLLDDEAVTDISEIINEYDSRSRVQPAVASTEPAQTNEKVKDEDELDDSEDAMAAALAETGSNEEAAIAEEDDLDDSEDAMAAALAGDDSDEKSESNDESDQTSEKNTTIVQRHPSLDEDQVFAAKTVLAEIGMDRMFFFCSENFTEGQSIVIEFLVPKKFVINAEVVYCRLFNMKSRIISKIKLPYRVAVDFNFLKEGERTLLRQFLKTVEPEIQEQVQNSAGKQDDEDEDEFSELDDL